MGVNRYVLAESQVKTYSMTQKGEAGNQLREIPLPIQETYSDSFVAVTSVRIFWMICEEMLKLFRGHKLVTSTKNEAPTPC